ncbi:MAG: serine/threonine protein kinase [Burkholderiales bacterium]|nr:serine/threonine protein kinase [Burkholderiales bacterium]
MNFSPGTELYKYVLQYKIGGGHFGQVWLALDATLNTNVAVKLLDEKMAPAAVILKEAQVGNRLKHQNVVRVHYADVIDFGSSRVVVIAMDHVANGSVLGKVNPGNFIIAPTAVALIVDVLRGLEYLHEQNLFHNDIKPSNILLGSSNEALITDYGISCVSPGLVPIEAPNAYILHRAPETNATNTISVTTDIYQVGLTLFRLLNGIGLIKDLRAKVGDAEFETLKIQGKVPPQNGYMPFVIPSLRKIITKATNPNPTLRYQSALEMRRALERILMFGYWDVASNGEFNGILKQYLYTITISKSKTGYEFNAHKTNQESGRTTNVSKFSAKALSESKLNDLKRGFMVSVVNGDA